jgi:hypothetical protein
MNEPCGVIRHLSAPPLGTHWGMWGWERCGVVECAQWDASFWGFSALTRFHLGMRYRGSDAAAFGTGRRRGTAQGKTRGSTPGLNKAVRPIGVRP